jgi:hypothetical protein
MTRRKQFEFGAIAMLAAAFFISMPARVAAEKSETFVSYEIAAVRIDGNPPPEWNLYHLAHGKFNEVVLLEWGKRVIRLDERLKEARELKAESVTRKKGSIVWAVNDSATTVLASDEWIYRDVGNVQRLHLVLTSENHDVDIELPHYAK